MSGLNENDIAILRRYADSGNRELYWDYLAQKEGGDGYGLLALGVGMRFPPARASAQRAQEQLRPWVPSM